MRVHLLFIVINGNLVPPIQLAPSLMVGLYGLQRQEGDGLFNWLFATHQDLIALAVGEMDAA